MRVLQVIKRSKQALIVTAMITLLPLLSCNGEVNPYRYQLIDRGEWHRDTILIFAVDSLFPADDKLLEISLEITSNNSYPYRDLWMMVEQNLTDTLFHADTLRVMMADEKGRQLGSSVGGLHQLSIPWLKFSVDDQTRPSQIRIRHLMTDDPLPGIEKAGIKIVAADKTDE